MSKSEQKDSSASALGVHAHKHTHTYAHVQTQVNRATEVKQRPAQSNTGISPPSLILSFPNETLHIYNELLEIELRCAMLSLPQTWVRGSGVFLCRDSLHGFPSRYACFFPQSRDMYVRNGMSSTKYLFL